jgi:hypothetical protein
LTIRALAWNLGILQRTAWIEVCGTGITTPTPSPGSTVNVSTAVGTEKMPTVARRNVPTSTTTGARTRRTKGFTSALNYLSAITEVARNAGVKGTELNANSGRVRNASRTTDDKVTTASSAAVPSTTAACEAAILVTPWWIVFGNDYVIAPIWIGVAVWITRCRRTGSSRRSCGRRGRSTGRTRLTSRTRRGRSARLTHALRLSAAVLVRTEISRRTCRLASFITSIRSRRPLTGFNIIVPDRRSTASLSRNAARPFLSTDITDGDFIIGRSGIKLAAILRCGGR